MQIELNDMGFIASGKDEEFICCKCNHPVGVGFICKSGDLTRVFCESCQQRWNEENVTDLRCKVDLIKTQEHQHIKFIKK